VWLSSLAAQLRGFNHPEGNVDAGYRGSFVWHELMTADPAGASAFYSKLIKWKAEPWDADPSYTLFMAGGMPIAGVMKMTDEVRAMGGTSNWLAYIGTPDVDATVNAAVKLGAKVMKGGMDIPKVGRIAVLMDPQGACFGVHKPATEMPAPAAPLPGDFCWHELASADPEASLKFYGTLFGWTESRRMDMGAHGTYYIFGKGGKDLGGLYKSAPDVSGPPVWLSYSDVGDARQVAGLIKASGGRVTQEPHQVPGGGWIVMGVDAQGASFAVHEAPPAAKPAAAPAKPAAAPKPKAKAKAKPKAKTKAKAKPAMKRKVAGKSKPASKPKRKGVKPRGKKKKATMKRRPARKAAARKK